MSDKSKEIVKREVKISCCVACGIELKNHSILVCSECLDDECGKFQKMAETFDSKEHN